MPGGIPICDYVPGLKLFRVLHSKGKCFASGGYGVSVAERDEEQNAQSNVTEQKEERDEGVQDESVTDTPKVTKSPSEYLFLEEALFLHERGLLEVYRDKTKLDSSQLYSMFDETKISLAAYLVYAHLRSQTFVVVRHTPRRLELLRQVQAASTDTKNWKKRKRSVGIQQAMRELKRDARNAPPPTVMKDNTVAIAFDVYQPNAAFRKTNPGPPDFYVAISNYSLPSPPMTQLYKLVESCQGISLRIATVADGGTVVMFGLTDIGVPVIASNESDS